MTQISIEPYHVLRICNVIFFSFFILVYSPIISIHRSQDVNSVVAVVRNMPFAHYLQLLSSTRQGRITAKPHSLPYKTFIDGIHFFLLLLLLPLSQAAFTFLFSAREMSHIKLSSDWHYCESCIRIVSGKNIEEKLAIIMRVILFGFIFKGRWMSHRNATNSRLACIFVWD